MYFDTAGLAAYDYFWKDNLQIMHSYRGDVEHAKYTGNGSRLQKYRRKTIMTYDGPELRGYDNHGVRIYPETSLGGLSGT